MTYLLLDAAFIGAAALVLVVARRRAGAGGRPSTGAIVWTIAGLAVLTLVFDNLMIAAGLFGYGEEHLVGVLVGRAPIEDLGYPVTTALLLPAVWHLLARRRDRRELV